MRVFKDATISDSNNLILKSNCNTNQNTKTDNKSKAHVDVCRVSTNKTVNEYITNKLIE